MPFLGRKREIEILRDVYNNEKFESIILYGRRRIGKSELIKYSFKDINCKKIYFECQKLLRLTMFLIYAILLQVLLKYQNLPFKHLVKF